MTNSIKFILNKCGIKQKELMTEDVNKQMVSAYILRKNKIRLKVIPHWEKILKVPSKYFIDEHGLCKELNKNELTELSNYLDGCSAVMTKYKDEYWGYWIECECGYKLNVDDAKYCGGCGRRFNVIEM